MTPHLYIAIPAIDELEYLPQTLSAIQSQVCSYPFHVFICVNQPEEWWEDDEKRIICLHNQELITYLHHYKSFPLEVIDRSSKGKGWQGKQHGVGWARKTLFDHILSVANSNDIIISLDADTTFGNSYFQSIGNNFTKNKDIPAISVPYYHLLTHNEEANRAILRYEIYMRNWVLNLYRIKSPYHFTAIGSAIAIRVETLKRIGGITPMKSGEDFYLLQKIQKMAPISNWNEQMVYPAARFSNRVYFGTGPAMIKGNSGDWCSYPIYHYSVFNHILNGYTAINKLFINDIQLPFFDFLAEQFKCNQLWQPLRKNYKEYFRFERAFHEKADALRILQFLKQEQKHITLSNEECLFENWSQITSTPHPDYIASSFSFDDLSIKQLDNIRNILFEEEQKSRQDF